MISTCVVLGILIVIELGVVVMNQCALIDEIRDVLQHLEEYKP